MTYLLFLLIQHICIQFCLWQKFYNKIMQVEMWYNYFKHKTLERLVTKQVT